MRDLKKPKEIIVMSFLSSRGSSSYHLSNAS
jgi:hypothetical protein